MTKKYEDLILKLRQTLRWRPEVAKTTSFFTDVATHEYEKLIQQLIDAGETE